QKISFKFDLYTIIIGALLGLSFVMSLVHNIIRQMGFIAFEFWLLRYAFLALLFCIFLVARALKHKELMLITTTLIVAHYLIFPVGTVSFNGFLDFEIQTQIIVALVLIALILLIVASFIKVDIYEKVETFYKYVVAVLFALIGFVFLLDTFINGFRDYGDFRWTRAFFALSGVFYYAALVGLFALPILDTGILTPKKKETVQEVEVEVKSEEEKPKEAEKVEAAPKKTEVKEPKVKVEKETEKAEPEAEPKE
ncbi:MAG TPA: hypothetical protein PLQ55_04725, partial [Bacilli bacterium]|nr:hypothetical protein [Bacilli bacterium]